jgi:hypothetical protein
MSTAWANDVPHPERLPERDPRPPTSGSADEEERAAGGVTRQHESPAPGEPLGAGSRQGAIGQQDEIGDERYRADGLNEAVDEQDPTSDDPNDKTPGDHDAPEVPAGTAEAVAYWLSKEPDVDLEVLAGRIGKSLRSVYRHLPPDYPRKPGLARGRARHPTDQAR